MKAFLLVAGRGERLRPLTDTTPKCLLPIGSRPLLEIWLANLQQSGICDILINTGWLHEQVEDFVDEWCSLHTGMKITLFHEPELLGSGGTLLANRQWVGEDPFFIIYGDNLSNINLLKMYDFHLACGQLLTMRVYRGADPARAGIVLLDERGVITDFAEKPGQPKSDIGAGGIYITDRRIYDCFPESHDPDMDGVLDLSYHILPGLAGRMQAYESREISIDIGTPASYEQARRVWFEIS